MDQEVCHVIPWWPSGRERPCPSPATAIMTTTTTLTAAAAAITLTAAAAAEPSLLHPAANYVFNNFYYHPSLLLLSGG